MEARCIVMILLPRQPVSRLFESQPADEGAGKQLFPPSFNETLDRMEAYLLGDGGIPSGSGALCYGPGRIQNRTFMLIPGGKEEFNSQLLFIQYLMKHL